METSCGSLKLNKQTNKQKPDAVALGLPSGNW